MSMRRKSNHSEVLAMLDEAKEMTALQKQIVESDLESKGYDVEKLWAILNFQLEEQGRLGIFERNLETDEGFLKRTYLSCRIKEDGTEEEPQEIPTEGLSSEMIKIFGDLLDIKDSEEELCDLEDESTTAMRKYVDNMSSPEKEEKRLDDLERNRVLLEKATDPIQRKRLERMIYNGESRYNLAFVFERMHNPKYREKEMKNMIDTFFDSKSSSYVMQKYIAKATQCGKNPGLYRYFHGLEEKYLEEKYHVYNNFFLFSCLRYIAYADAYTDYPRIQAIFNDFGNLIYNRFVNDAVKEQFLNAARGFLDEFEYAREKFEADNILHPKHPYRVQKDQEREAEQRKEICKHLTEIKAIEDVTEEINAMSLEELIAFAKEKDDAYKHRQHVCEEILHLQMMVDNAQGTVSDESEMDLDAKTIEELVEQVAALREKAKKLYEVPDDDENDDDEDEEDEDADGDTVTAPTDDIASAGSGSEPSDDSAVAEDHSNDTGSDTGSSGPKVLKDSFAMQDSCESV